MASPAFYEQTSVHGIYRYATQGRRLKTLHCASFVNGDRRWRATTTVAIKTWNTFE